MYRLLIVEDEIDLRFLVEKLFSSNGYKTFGVSSKEELYIHIDSFNPHVILIDVMLGEDDGRHICNQLQSSHNHIHTILVSAREDLLVAYKDYGAKLSFTKPYSIKAMVREIDHLLKQQKRSIC